VDTIALWKVRAYINYIVYAPRKSITIALWKARAYSNHAEARKFGAKNIFRPMLFLTTPNKTKIELHSSSTTGGGGHKLKLICRRYPNGYLKLPKVI